MKIYLATGFTVINVPGRERELAEKFKKWDRLISFYDTYTGNRIENTIEFYKKELK